MSSREPKTGFLFTVGLTGHRDISAAAMADVRAALRTELETLNRRFESLPVELVTGLAEGADTLATEIALELGMPVRAVLPMPRSLFEADFEGAALEHFRRLADDDRVIVEELPLPAGEGDEDFSDGPARDGLYGRLMDYLVRRSNVLIALWDGEVTGLVGGSSDVVIRYLSTPGTSTDRTRTFETTDDLELAEDQSDLVVWIKTPRQSDSSETEGGRTSYLVQAGTAGLLCQSSKLPEFVFERWNQFDQHAAELGSAVDADLTAYPLSAEGDAGIAEIAPFIDLGFVRADQLAMANQLQSDRLFKLFGLMAALMGLMFLLYAKIAAFKWFLITYVVLFAAGYALFSVSARRGWFGRHLAYRVLAEVLRIRFFLVLSGSRSEVSTRRLLRLTSIERFRGFEWIGDAIRCSEPLTYESNVPAQERVAATAVRWVKDQSAYFRKKHHQLHAQHERLESVKRVLFLASFLGAVSLLLFKKILYGLHVGDLDSKTLLVFLMGLLPLWLAIWEIYQTKMATRELLWQYTNQGALFDLAEKRLAATSDPDLARNVIADLAERSFMDVILWSTHRYHREHEPPAAG